MKIAKCPACGRVFAVQYEMDMGPVRYRCPNPECAFTDYGHAFHLSGKNDAQSMGGSVLYESVDSLTDSLQMITEQNIQALARAHGCSVRAFVSLINHLLKSNRAPASRGSIEKLRYARLEKSTVSLEDVLNELRAVVRPSVTDKENESLPTDDYRERYFSLKEDFEKLQSDKKKLLVTLHRLNEENKEMKQILGY